MNLWLLVPWVVVFGLLVGSFLTVVVDRVPDGRSIVRPPSACDACGNRLTPTDLVPVASWVVLRGRCRHCGASIGAQPLWIELTNVAVWVAFALRFNGDADAGIDSIALLPAYLIFGSALVALSWIDLRIQRLPREIIFVAMGLGAVALAIGALVIGEPKRIWMAALGAAIALAIIGAIYLAANWRYGTDVAFGFGDVILSPLLGMFLGFLNPGIVAPGIFFGFILGAIAAVVAMSFGSADRKTALPFGPFLALGAILAVFIGQHFVDLVMAR